MTRRKKMALALLLIFALIGPEAAAYFWTAWDLAAAFAKDNVPMEFEIDRARHMVEDLAPEIAKNMRVVAKEEVEVERLNDEVSQGESELAKDRSEIMRLQADLATGQGVFKYAARTYSSGEVKADLANRFARYKTANATLASLRQVRDGRHHSLVAVRKKLEGMLEAKRQLEVELENIAARLKAVEVAQTTSTLGFDESQLSRTKKLVSDLRTRLAIAEKVVNAEAQDEDKIPLDDEMTKDITDQVTEFFNPK